MIVADVPLGELQRRLDSWGLRLRIGPLVVHITSPFGEVAESIALHYAAHEVASAADFADFHVAVNRPAGLRRLFKSQAQFRFEGDFPFNPLPADQAFPLFEWGLNWCVSANCHQYLVLHAAVIERDGRAVLMPAPPGAGKSTLCAALVSRGWRLFSDELALIDVASRDIVALPRPISLKNASINIIRSFWPEVVMNRVVPCTLNGSVVHARPPEESVRLMARTARPGWVVVPFYKAGEATSLVPLGKASTFMQLVDAAFNYGLQGRRGFDTLADVVEASSCFRFSYGGELDEAIRVFAQLR